MSAYFTPYTVGLKMKPFQPPFSNNEHLNDLLRQAKEAVQRMTPDEKAAMLREQRISWAYGQLTCTGRRDYITREMVEKMHDQMYGPGGRYEGK